MITYLAGSCFPNCHPAGQSGFQASGDTALILAVLCIIAIIVLKVLGK